MGLSVFFWGWRCWNIIHVPIERRCVFWRWLIAIFRLLGVLFLLSSRRLTLWFVQFPKTIRFLVWFLRLWPLWIWLWNHWQFEIVILIIQLKVGHVFDWLLNLKIKFYFGAFFNSVVNDSLLCLILCFVSVALMDIQWYIRLIQFLLFLHDRINFINRMSLVSSIHLFFFVLFLILLIYVFNGWRQW